jgi:ribosomal protein S18 acetylase RimI-like enzyme
LHYGTLKHFGKWCQIIKEIRVKVVSARDAHISGIVEIWKEFMDFHKNIEPHFSRRKDGHLNFQKFVRKLLKSRNSQVLVALDDSNVIAYSIARIAKYPPVFKDKTYGAIFDLAVKSNCRRKGIGKRMLGEILEWFKSKKMLRIELSVVSKNKIGYSFWKKHGFQDYMHKLYLKLNK